MQRKLSGADLARVLGPSYKLARSFTFDRATVDAEARTVELSISSESPYERWFGVEILDHGQASVRMDRLRDGAPLLMNHDTWDWRAQVGVLQNVRIEDRRIRATARFSESATAQEIFRDVQQGIRTKTSVAYRIHEMVLESEKAGVSTYRVTDWEPYEGSIVAVPADTSVGVGRSASPAPSQPQPETERNRTMPEVQTPSPAEQAAAVERAAREAQAAEQQRVSSILTVGREFADIGGLDLAAKLAGDPTKTLADLQRELLTLSRAKPPVGTPTAEPAGTPFGQGARGFIPHKQLRAFTREHYYGEQGQKLGREEAAYRAGMWAAAVIYGHEPSRKWCGERGIDTQVRVMTTGTNTLGGALVPTELEQAIIDLRDTYGVARRLARVRAMGSDSKSIPRRKGGITAYFVGEDTAGVTASDKNWDNVQLNAKTLAALALMSIQLEEDAIIDLGDDVAQEMAWAFSKKEDECLFIGDGSSAYGGMVGLVTKFEATAYASRALTGSGRDTLPEIDATDIANLMGAPAAYGKPGAAFVCSETFASLVFDRLAAAAGGNTVQSIAGAYSRRYLGYEIVTSETLPAGPSTDYTSKVMAFFGRIDLSSSFGARRGIFIQVLRERYAEKLQVGVLGHERLDIVKHELGSTPDKGPVAALYGNS